MKFIRTEEGQYLNPAFIRDIWVCAPVAENPSWTVEASVPEAGIHEEDGHQNTIFYTLFSACCEEHAQLALDRLMGYDVAPDGANTVVPSHAN